jgi:hypothetical protein
MLTTTVLAALLTGLSPEEPHGAYVEARTAAVFAGACHYGSQFSTQGREALLAWRFEGGAHQGVELDGVELAVAVSAAENLDLAAAPRVSVVFLDPEAGTDVERAVLGWLRARHTPTIGTLLGVERVPVEVSLQGEEFRVRVGTEIELAGASLPERACCRMPYDVWYRPFEALAEPRVGLARVFRFADERLDRRWSRPDENSAFHGRFGGRSAAVR